MRNALVLLAALGVMAGCLHGQVEPPATATRQEAGSRGTWRGVAENHKVGAFLRGANLYVDLAETHWPQEMIGKTLEVQGLLVQRHDLPVFVPEADHVPVAGIPVPPGTDLHEASMRLIVEQAKWKVVGSARPPSTAPAGGAVQKHQDGAGRFRRMEQITRIEGDGSQYVGKRLLVGITYENHEGKALRQEQFHGVIVEAGKGGIVIIRDDTGERKSLPPELKTAPAGEYRLRTTGEVVVDPDYLATWVMKEPPPGEDAAE